MEIKVKPKAVESTTMMATKEEDEIKKTMKDCVVIGQEADEEVGKGQGETRQADSKKLEIDKNFTSQKTKKKEENKKEENNNYISNMKHKKTSSHVWDCGSTLYDSFELNSFKRQLDSAISASSARTMSMSRLPDRRLPPLSSLSPENPPPLPSLPTTSSSSSSGGKKHSNKISRSLQRFLKSVFKPKQHQSLSTPSSPVYKAVGHGGGGDKDRYYVVYDKSGSLTTIPESTSEKEVSPEINSLVRKTVSERFPASRVVGISCA
ncbi:PREDICTED: uncharacterized protein LOC104724553 [Camelina sativa]|uniref:Uncharacterized protein LOC104724553 n=1 Tax=Camelina sativa TaxID=90675 RepID=A0ABM0UHT3_CAMSA|nr:PREDICTED: uncharacterized protein LOC104724553 [Camelina sativa]XP_010441360.1 PREDICTED: uncharacterized protein LOC104724553 [Camelina sativa]